MADVDYRNIRVGMAINGGQFSKKKRLIELLVEAETLASDLVIFVEGSEFAQKLQGVIGGVQRSLPTEGGNASSGKQVTDTPDSRLVEIISGAIHSTDIAEGRFLTIDNIKSPAVPLNDDVIVQIQKSNKELRDLRDSLQQVS